MTLYNDHISLKVDTSRLENNKSPDFLLYVMDISYFSGKLEMYFRYRNFNFLRIEPTLSELHEIKKKTGTSQVPLVYDRLENVWLRDTTYIIRYMEEKYIPKPCQSPIYPDCAIQQFISLILEDFADEYMWRPAMYMRWEPGVDSKVVSTRFVWEFVDRSGFVKLLPKSLASSIMIFRQWLFSVFGEGIVEPLQHTIVKSQFYAVMDSLQTILENTPFILGSHPTIADFGLLGPFFRHFSSDPTPRKIMQQQAPEVYEWVARMWNCKTDKLQPYYELVGSTEIIPATWKPLFPLIKEYLKYLHQNALAWKRNEPSFKFLFQGGHSIACYSLVQTVPYRVWCRLEMQKRFLELQAKDEEKTQQLTKLLKELEWWDPLWKDGMIECAAEFGSEPPFCKPYPNAKTPDTPKWSLEFLLMRFFKEKVQTIWLIGFIIAGFIFAYIHYCHYVI